MKDIKPIDENLLTSLFNQKLSISLIEKKMGISRYRIVKTIEKLKLKSRDEIIVKQSEPSQEWTDERKKAFMKVYREEGTRSVTSMFNVSKQYAPVLAMRFRRAGY